MKRLLLLLVFPIVALAQDYPNRPVRMLVGYPPFDAADSYSIGYKHVHEQPASPDVVDSRVPAAMAHIVMRCLAKAAGERYQRGNDLADALIAFLGATGAADEQRSAWIPRRTGATPSNVRS